MPSADSSSKSDDTVAAATTSTFFTDSVAVFADFGRQRPLAVGTALNRGAFPG